MRADGKVVAVGSDGLANSFGATHAALVARFTRSGAPDTTFAAGGFARVALTGSDGGLLDTFATGVAFDHYGRVVVVGYAMPFGTPTETVPFIARFWP